VQLSSVISKMSAVTQLMFTRGPERHVSKRWLLKTHTQLFREFERTRRIEVERRDDFTYVNLDGTPYVWPRDAAVEPLLHLLAELTTPDHPHQYQYGATHVRDTDVVLDVGCCEGGFAAIAATAGAKVIAVEPSATMATVIRRLFELRQLPAPEIRQCLLASAPGRAYFQDNVLDPAQSQITSEELAGSYPLAVTTIDELTAEMPQKPTYIKCDAEGADFSILQGGREFLREHRPRIAVTTYHHPDDFRKVCEFLEPLGYAVEGKGLMYVAGRFHVMMVHAA
jgi:FkbM family methyltransferase